MHVHGSVNYQAIIRSSCMLDKRKSKWGMGMSKNLFKFWQLHWDILLVQCELKNQLCQYIKLFTCVWWSQCNIFFPCWDECLFTRYSFISVWLDFSLKGIWKFLKCMFYMSRGIPFSKIESERHETVWFHNPSYISAAFCLRKFLLFSYSYVAQLFVVMEGEIETLSLL